MSSKVQKAQLVEAIQEGNEDQISKEWKKVEPVLYNYLISTMNASAEDAQDCVQQSLLTVIEKARSNAISNPDQIKNYLLRCCKHNYFRIIERKQREHRADDTITPVAAADQIENLVEEQNSQLLQMCLEKLSDFNRAFISELFNNPEINLTQLAAEYDMKSNAAWTRKHRIIQKLVNCINKFET